MLLLSVDERKQCGHELRLVQRLQQDLVRPSRQKQGDIRWQGIARNACMWMNVNIALQTQSQSQQLRGQLLPTDDGVAELQVVAQNLHRLGTVHSYLG